MIFKTYMYLTGLAAQVVNFDFGTTQTLILYARSIFKGGQLKKCVVKNLIDFVSKFLFAKSLVFCSVLL
jgi:hypothetical protein